jgi:nucleotide-binding universal stress UspA family protein
MSKEDDTQKATLGESVPDSTKDDTQKATLGESVPDSTKDDTQKATLGESVPDSTKDDTQKATSGEYVPVEESDKAKSVVLSGYVRIMVPHDGSAMSDKALGHAIYLAKTSGAELVIIHVLEKISDAKVTSLYISSKGDSDKENEIQAGNKVTLEGQSIRLIEDKMRTCKENGVKQVSYKVQVGNPADEIIKLSHEIEFDLIVMASKKITSRFLGSTTRKVIDTLKKPVLIIPVT